MPRITPAPKARPRPTHTHTPTPVKALTYRLVTSTLLEAPAVRTIRASGVALHPNGALIFLNQRGDAQITFSPDAWLSVEQLADAPAVPEPSGEVGPQAGA